MTSKRLEQLEKQYSALGNRIQKMQATEKSRERKRETRRKILVGSYYLDQAQQQDTYPQLVNLMDGYLKREADRKLFDLPLGETEKKTGPLVPDTEHVAT